MAPRIRDFLLHPDTFFSEIAAGETEYKIPLIIVGTCMVLDAIRQFLLADWIQQAIISALPALTGMQQINDLVFGALNFLIIVSVIENIPAFIAYWLIIAAVFHIISSYFSCEGTIYKMIIATGWGMAPLIVYNAIAVPLFLMYRNVMTLTISPEAFNQTPSRYHRSSFSSGLSDSPDYTQYVHFNQQYIEHAQIGFAVFAVSLLCCSIFWLYAVKNVRNISLVQAAVSTVLPVAIYLAILLGIKMMNGWA